MNKLVHLAAVAGAALSAAALTLPTATGAPAQHTSYTMRGTVAEAYWFTEEEPPLGSPGSVAVIGADATTREQVAGERATRGETPSVVAMGIMRPGPEPGDEPQFVELWGISYDAAFSTNRTLATATLSFDTVAEYYAVDPETGEEVPTGEQVPLTVEATWTATGPAIKDSVNSRYVVGPHQWTRERVRATFRPASAEVEITSPDGILFSGPMLDSQIYRSSFATMVHG